MGPRRYMGLTSPSFSRKLSYSRQGYALNLFFFLPFTIGSKAVDGVVHHPKAGKINDGDAQTKKETNLIKELFNPKNFQEAWRTLIKKREGHKKMFIILLIVAFELEMFLR